MVHLHLGMHICSLSEMLLQIFCTDALGGTLSAPCQHQNAVCRIVEKKAVVSSLNAWCSSTSRDLKN